MDRKALVTGASGGIGRSIAIELAKKGIHVWVHYLNNKSRAEKTIEIINNNGGKSSLVRFDVSDQRQCQLELERLIDEQGAIDILVLNAGKVDDAPLPGMLPEQWKSVIDTSLNSFYNITRPLIMSMIRKRWGRIISISSIAAIHGNRGQSNYAAAKAGLIGASMSLAKEVASRGICVNVVAPGFIETTMIDSIDQNLIRQTVPMKRAGKPEEVAHVVSFLCSDDASYVTGETINVSGGIC